MLLCDTCYRRLENETDLKNIVLAQQHLTCCRVCADLLDEKAKELVLWMTTARIGGAVWAEGLTPEQVQRVGGWFYRGGGRLPPAEPLFPDRKEHGVDDASPPKVTCFACGGTRKVKLGTFKEDDPSVQPIEVDCPACGGEGSTVLEVHVGPSGDV